MVASGAAAAPCRPQSARYAEKGYPNYGELDGRRAPRWREDDGGAGSGRAKKSVARRGRKRGCGEVPEAATAGKVQTLGLQVEEAVAQAHGRTKRRIEASAKASGKVFPMIEEEEGEGEVVSTDGGSDERGVGKSCRLRVKETLRAFSSHYLHFVQEEQRRAEAVRHELKASRALKHQSRNNKNNDVYLEVKRACKRPDLKALTKGLMLGTSSGHVLRWLLWAFTAIG